MFPLTCDSTFKNSFFVILYVLNKSFNSLLILSDKIVAYSAKGQIYAPCGRCRELIRMVNDKNLNTEVMVAEDKIYKLKDLLPEMYITKTESNKNM